ncbi:hypothetical protein [Bifidobacterium pullorum]|uniref:hypothetical protein n=1 Tax=Bifidobacterium pullorum TaxID=78448 RepID=UPI002432757C|nr:hypothetical protein [Bifidobacterium pullorum]
MRNGKFTAKERAYLLTLPAVESVTQGRIFYTEEFKADCMRRYHEGDSPMRIFAEAGLYSDLIGYKRIERCVSRWRESERKGRLAYIASIEAREQDLDSNSAESDTPADTAARGGASETVGEVEPHLDAPASDTTLDEQDQQMLDEVIKRGRRRWRVKDRTVPPDPSSHAADVSGLLLVRYEARLRSLERQVADLKDEVRRLRG